MIYFPKQNETQDQRIKDISFFELFANFTVSLDTKVSLETQNPK